jgi:CDP-glucose 4,6-dehydratase
VDDVAGLTPRALPSAAFWSGKRVFLTGHTGFKGGWLSLWLHQLGATVSGYALPPDTTPNLFTAASISQFVQHQFGDVRDAATLTRAVIAFQPDIVLHLAAQPLVRTSYAIPVETFATNIMGTAHLLDAVRQTPATMVTLIITSDKVYAESNDGRHHENGRLGGHDPYSASKACAELVTASFPLTRGQKLASVRSGNVIGGGDWAADRLLPDFFRSMFAHESWRIRNPHAIRPWQHVLDPLCGYLTAAEHLWTHKAAPAQAWNFGPDGASEVTVHNLAGRLCRLWGEGATYHVETQPDAPHEAPVLRLSSEKALRELNWRPGWQLEQALAATTAWFHAFRAAEDIAAFTQSQIKAYCET